MGYSKNDFAGFKSRAPANWLRGKTTLGVHFCYCLKFCRRQIYTQHCSVSAITLESLRHRDCNMSQRENFQRGDKIMEIQKGIKLVKRVWTAVALAELVFAAGALLFIFSHYFSYSVFVSNLHHEANAANVAQR